jgi:hypothetical protein
MFLVILVGNFGHWIFFVILPELLLFGAIGVAGGKRKFAAAAPWTIHLSNADIGF